MGRRAHRTVNSWRIYWLTVWYWLNFSASQIKLKSELQSEYLSPLFESSPAVSAKELHLSVILAGVFWRRLMADITGVALLFTLGHHILGQYGSVIPDVQNVVPLYLRTSFCYVNFNPGFFNLYSNHCSMRSSRAAHHQTPHSKASYCTCSKI